MLRRIILACALVATLAFLPSSAVGGNDTNGANCNGYWKHFDYQPLVDRAGPATARFEWHCNYYDDGDLRLEGFVDTGFLDPGYCVQIAIDAPWEGDESTGHADAQILRNCDPHSRVWWPGGLRRVDTGTVNGTERVFRIQVSLFHQDTSPVAQATYFPVCRYFPGWELRPNQCEEWNPWGPNTQANTRWTLQRGDGDDFYWNDGGWYWGAKN